MDIKGMRAQTNMTQKEFGEYFNIPVRTLQDWEAKKRTPPIYVVELIQYKVEKERLGMLRLVQADHGKRTVLIEGWLEDVLTYLKNNDLFSWTQDEDPNVDLPDLDAIDNLRDLEYELDKVDLSWWSLEVEKV